MSCLSFTRTIKVHLGYGFAVGDHPVNNLKGEVHLLLVEGYLFYASIKIYLLITS